MIAKSRLMAALCGLGALSLHAAPALYSGGDDTPDLQGSTAEISQAAIGSTFADMVAGEHAPVSPTHTAHSQTPHITPPVAAQTTQALTPATQQTAQSLPPAQNVTAKTPPALKPIVQQTPPSKPLQPTPLVKPDAQPPARPVAALTPIPQPKPQQKPAQQPRTKTPSKPQDAQEKPRPAKPAGNAPKTARKGTSEGTAGAKSANANQHKSPGTTAGNAAIDSYKGKVLRKIRRAKGGRVNARGKTLVSLTIAPNGQLATLRIARSSGSKKLDTLALQRVRRAAPFAAPPGGNSLKFSVNVSAGG